MQVQAALAILRIERLTFVIATCQQFKMVKDDYYNPQPTLGQITLFGH